VEPDFGIEDEGPFFAWLPPDDRLWRHPSEVPDADPGGTVAASKGGSSGSGPSRPVGVASAPWPRGVPRTWTVAVVAGAIGALAASGVGMLTGAFQQDRTVVQSVIPSTPPISLAADSGATVDWTAVDDAVSPSVVSISVAGPSGQATGSGLLLIEGTNEAYVVTDRSLLTGGGLGFTGSIQVTFLSGEQAAARVVGMDTLSGLAVIAVPNSRRIFPTLGSVSELAVANPVLAVGARTAGGGSVLPGSVSAEDQDVDLANGADMQNLIAVSSPTMPGQVAGGPLVDQYGRVVGITVNIEPIDNMDQNLTFAVPVDEAKRVAQEVLAGEPVTHPWIGVANSVDLSSAVARQMGLAGGARAGTILPGSPAQSLGMNPNDIITSFDGQPVTSCGTFTALLEQSAPGRTEPISYIHLGHPTTASVLVSNEPYNS
jgi:putative serine protease PepD